MHKTYISASVIVFTPINFSPLAKCMVIKACYVCMELFFLETDYG